MNKAILAGRFTKDPDIKYTQDQKAVARFTLAVNRKGKDKGADFISCVAWGKTAEFCEKYFKKGMKADLSGSIHTGSYEGKNGKVYTTEVWVDDIEFGESKGAASEKPAEEWVDVPDDSELPFN